MRLANLIPNFLKPMLKPLYRAFVSLLFEKKRALRPKNLKEIHSYWRQPWDGFNLPQYYLEVEPRRSEFLVKIVTRYAKQNASILEIGCNVGRNLNHLFLAGFKELTGIEISKNAVQLLRQSYPEMARLTTIYNAPVEEVIRGLTDGEFDVVFTMAVLEHIHTDSEWVFPEIVRITKDLLITIEDEQTPSWRHFPRNYKTVFEPLGMKQIEELNCNSVGGLDSNYLLRVFKKANMRFDRIVENRISESIGWCSSNEPLRM